MTEEGNISDGILVAQLANANEKAFRRLFDKYRDDIYRYSFSLLKSRANAEEIVQDVFLKIWTSRSTLDPARCFKSLLYTIAKHLCFNFMKKAANNQQLRNEVFHLHERAHNPLERQFIETEYNMLCELALEKLPVKRRIIYKMSREENKSYDEISRELHISVSTVKNQISKSLASMRSFLNTHGDFTLILLLGLFL
jgi:RNA polymerase sigma-70 factor (ECF subfamily)